MAGIRHMVDNRYTKQYQTNNCSGRGSYSNCYMEKEMNSDEPVIVILDDEGSSMVPDPVGNVMGLYQFVIIFTIVCFLISWVGTRRRK